MKQTILSKALAILLMAVLFIETFSFGALAVECPANSHRFVNGICTVSGCGAFQAPTLKNNGTTTTTDDYYEITNAGKLFWFAQYVNSGNTSANANLTSNIYLNTNYVFNANGTYNLSAAPHAWTPIGTSTNKYKGVFDGKLKTIDGIYINGSQSNVGLFGYIDTNGTVKNTTIKNSYIYGSNNVGSVCGMNLNIIERCSSSAFIEGTMYIGGICGENNGTIKTCEYTGSIDASRYVGGICGKNANAVQNCLNNSSIESSAIAGGICGTNGGSLLSCLDIGTTNGRLKAGAVLGESSGMNTSITNCYYTGMIAFLYNGTTSVTDTQLSEGYVTYNLNGGKTDGTQAWYQNIDSGTVDETPKLKGGTVYYGYKDCNAVDKTYSNKKTYAIIPLHSHDIFEDIDTAYHMAICSICGHALIQQHNYNRWANIQNGQHRRYCVDCNRTEQRVHTYNLYTNNNDGTHKSYCTACSFLNTQTHTYAENNTDNGNGTHSGICTLCNGAYTVEHIYGEWNDTGNDTHIRNCSFCTNTQTESHTYDNGSCTKCKIYQPASKTTDKYDINNDGVKDIVYEIANAGNLLWFAGQINTTNATYNAKLIADITINNGYVFYEDGTYNKSTSPIMWVPIGNGTTQYTGIFDGNGKTINGVYFNNTSTTTVGLFGTIGSNGIVKNVTLTNSYINASRISGGICGVNNGTISNCTNNAFVNGGIYIGGICGENKNSVSNCTNNGNVKGTNNVGGIVGNCNIATITKSANNGNVLGNEYVGGVCGFAYYKTIDYCYNIGRIQGTTKVGGISGGVNDARLNNCYNTGVIVGSAGGGIYGATLTTFVAQNCYYLAVSETDSFSGTTFKTAAQFEDGTVAYALNGGITDGTQVWYQNIDNADTKDLTPKFTGGTVYSGYANCGSTEKGYSNTLYWETKPEHTYGDYVINENGTHTLVCGVCNTVQTDSHVYTEHTDNTNGTHNDSCVCGHTLIKEHTYGEWSDNGDGNHSATCVCGAIQTEAHTYISHSYYDLSTHTSTCSCGVTENFAHIYGEWQDNSDGNHIRTCAGCNNTETQTHIYSESSDNGDGNHINTCICGATETQAHIYGDWSDSGEGKHTRICTVCDRTETQDHYYQNWTDNGVNHIHTCFICGATETAAHVYGDTSFISTQEHIRTCLCGHQITEHHSYGESTNVDEIYHKHQCNYCGYSESLPHNKTNYENLGDGTHSSYCADCGASHIENHIYSFWIPGNITEHERTCSCGASEKQPHTFGEWSDSGENYHICSCHACNAVQTLSHVWVTETETPANCHEKGSAHSACSLCTATQDIEFAINPHNHDGDTEIRHAVAATNESNGYTGDLYCLGCNQIIEAGTVIQKLQANTLAQLLPDTVIIQDGIITGIDEQTTVGSIIVDGIKIYNAEGNELASDAYIGTGCVIKRVDSQGSAQEEAIVSVLGDIDGNGKISTFDAVQILKIVAELLTPDDAQRPASDIDANSLRTSYDAVVLLQYIAGLRTEL